MEYEYISLMFEVFNTFISQKVNYKLKTYAFHYSCSTNFKNIKSNYKQNNLIKKNTITYIYQIKYVNSILTKSLHSKPSFKPQRDII